MRADQLRVELHPRSPWEAMELGGALVRRHARAIWLPWLAVTLPVFAAINALAVAFGLASLAPLAMWWLKPAFDRIPLFVLSRAVFGDAPRVRETLASQWRWGWRWMPAYLLWRRLGPARALYLPVDLLEGGAHPAQRRRVIGGSVRGNAVLLTLACANFELVLALATFALAMLFVPVELMSESTRAAWALISQEPPQWALVAINAVLWMATSVIEPFYIGAGFGIYLDRRTQLEAWDVEIAFRRMRARAIQALGALACVCVLTLGLPGPVQAGPGQPQTANPCEGDHPPSMQQADQPLPDCLPDVFADVINDPQLDAAVERAWQDPLLSPTRKVTRWVPRQPRDAPRPQHRLDNPLMNALATLLGLVGEYGLWGLAALLALLLLRTRKHWLPWLRTGKRLPVADASPARVQLHADEDALPAQLADSLRALWAQGRQRRALALLYRASVEAMVARTGAVLVPGATEADCLRTARALRDEEDRSAFTQMVRAWQYAAYAGRLPAAGEFEDLLQRLGARFGWPA